MCRPKCEGRAAHSETPRLCWRLPKQRPWRPGIGGLRSVSPSVADKTRHARDRTGGGRPDEPDASPPPPTRVLPVPFNPSRPRPRPPPLRLSAAPHCALARARRHSPPPLETGARVWVLERRGGGQRRGGEGEYQHVGGRMSVMARGGCMGAGIVLCSTRGCGARTAQGAGAGGHARRTDVGADWGTPRLASALHSHCTGRERSADCRCYALGEVSCGGSPSIECWPLDIPWLWGRWARVLLQASETRRGPHCSLCSQWHHTLFQTRHTGPCKQSLDERGMTLT